MNKTLLTGRITKDPELRYTSTGIANVNFTIAVDRQMKDANGQRVADFINCVAWRQQADFIGRFVRKGNMLAIEGRIQTRNYQGQDGLTHYVTEVLVDSVENLTPRDPNAQPVQNTVPTYNNPTYGAPVHTAPNNNVQVASTPAMPETFEVAEDDLPF